MNLQNGATPLPQGVNTIAVTFPVPFEVTPAVVVPVVRNVSSDVTKYLIEAGVTDVTRFGFTAYLDVATNTANYELAWLAGAAFDVLDAVVAFTGRKITSYGVLTTLFGTGFKIPVIATSPQPAMKLLDADTFWSAVVQRSPEVPVSAVAGGRGPLSLAFDDKWGYIGGNNGWGRWPIDFSTAWGSQPFYVPFREAEVTITPVSGQLAYRIDYATPFGTGTVPVVKTELSDLSADPKQILSKLLTVRDLDGFEITFSSPPTANLKVYYMARQLPA